MRRTFLLICLGLLSAAWAQRPSYKSNIDLLQIPVTVLDRHGNPIPGLKRTDFAVEIDGRPATLAALDEGKPSAMAGAGTLPAMPPDTYSNLEAQVPAQRIILLIDYAHIPTEDLLELNREMGNWLKHPWPPGVEFAVFVFDRNMTLIQPFTPNPNEVKEALRDMVGNHRGRGQLEGLSRELTYLMGIGADVKGDLFHGPQLDGAASTEDGPTNGDPLAVFYANEARMLRHMQQIVERDQAISMLDTWEAFARLLAGIGGRKNVIWLTSSTTLLAANDHELEISQERLHTVFAELNQANVALFPIDITNLKSYTPLVEAAPLGRYGAPPGDPQTAIRARGLEDRQMDWAASETGGDAFGPSNDIGVSLGKVIHATSEGYVLSVALPKGTAPGNIHSIHINVRGHGERVLYRKSYRTPGPTTVEASRKQFLRDTAELAFNPLTLGSLTLVARTGDWVRTGTSATPAESLPFVVSSEMTPLLHRAEDGKRYYDFSFLRILIPLDGSADPVLLPTRHFHSVLAGNPSDSRRYAVRINSGCDIPAGHPYLLRMILRDNVNGRAGSLSLRLNAPKAKPEQTRK